MAKDREVEQSEAMERELDVNLYTIKYDPKVKRFFKGFAPKLASGGLISTAVFAGLGIATLITGGIAGIGIGTLAGASVAVGASAQSLYSGIVYGRNASKHRFKALDIGGKDIVLTTDERKERMAEYNDELKKHPFQSQFEIEGRNYSRKELKELIDAYMWGKTGTIGLIEAHDLRARKYIKLLNDYPKKNEFEFEDDITCSRKELKRFIDEDEINKKYCTECLKKYTELLADKPKQSEIVLEDGISYSRSEIEGLIGKYTEDKIKFEKRISKHTQLLKDYPSQRKFIITTDVKHSRVDINRIIKESEDIAYHGLKYILEQGLQISEDINVLNEKLKEDEEDENDQHILQTKKDKMDRIKDCVENLSTGREGFNPYKALVVDALLDGCLLGDDKQNEKIRTVATKKKKEDAFELYSNMYELKILNKLKKEREQQLDNVQSIHDETQQRNIASQEYNAKGKKIAEVSRQNKRLAKEYEDDVKNQTLIEIASRLIVSLPKDLAKERKALGAGISEFKKAVELKDTTKIKTKKDTLDTLVYDTQDKLYAWYSEKGKKEGKNEGLEKLQQQFEEYKAISEQAIAKQTQKYEKAVQRSWNKRGENKQLKQQLEYTETDLDNAVQGWYEAEERAEEANKTKARQRSVIKQQQTQLANEQAYSASLKTERDKALKRANVAEMEADFTNQALSAERKRAKKARSQTKRAIGIAQMAIGERDIANEKLAARTEERDFVRGYNEDMADTVTALYDNNVKFEQELRDKQGVLDTTTQKMRAAEERAEKAERDKAQMLAEQEAKDKKTGRRFARIIAKMIGSNKERQATIDAQQEQISEQQSQIGALEDERDTIKQQRDAAERTIVEQRDKNKRAGHKNATRIAQMKDENNAQKAENATRMAQMSASYKAKEEENARLQRQTDLVGTFLDGALEDNDNLRRKLENVQAASAQTIEQQRERISEQQSQIGALKGERDEFAKKYKTTKGKLIRSVGDNAELRAANQRLEDERDDARDVADTTHTEKVTLANEKQRVEAEKRDLANKYGVANLKLGNAEKVKARQQGVIDTQRQQLEEMGDQIQDLNNAQTENIDTIMGLQVKNEKLTKNLEDSKRATQEALKRIAKGEEIQNQQQAKLDKQAKEMAKRERERDDARQEVKEVRNKNATLEAERKAREKELAEAIETARQQSQIIAEQSQQVEYAQGVAYQEYEGKQSAEGELAQRDYKRDRGAVKTRLDKKSDAVWDHIKITEAENKNAYAESTSRVREKLLAVVMLKNNPSTDLEQLRKAEKVLDEVYKEESKKPGANWPKYEKPKKKTEIIPGTPVPASPDDEIYYSK